MKSSEVIAEIDKGTALAMEKIAPCSHSPAVEMSSRSAVILGLCNSLAKLAMHRAQPMQMREALRVIVDATAYGLDMNARLMDQAIAQNSQAVAKALGLPDDLSAEEVALALNKLCQRLEGDGS